MLISLATILSRTYISDFELRILEGKRTISLHISLHMYANNTST